MRALCAEAARPLGHPAAVSEKKAAVGVIMPGASGLPAQIADARKLVLLRTVARMVGPRKGQNSFSQSRLRSRGRVAGSDVRVVISWGEMRP